jgi:hypothetical protein
MKQMTDNIPAEIDQEKLVDTLDRLAMGFESYDPQIRHEAKMVAKQNFRDIASKVGWNE